MKRVMSRRTNNGGDGGDGKRTGHSTTSMAARYARGIGAKKLILTHLSSRYPACSARYEPPEIQEMRQLAISNYGSNNVCIAEDLMRIPL